MTKPVPKKPLADICPSCGSTDRSERMACANAWHVEIQPQQDAPSLEEYYREAYRRTLESEGGLLRELEVVGAALTQAREALKQAAYHLAMVGLDEASAEMDAALAATQPRPTDSEPLR